MKKTITMLMVLALATVAFAQTKPAATPAQQQASTDPIVIAAGDLSIRQSEFEAAIKTLPQEYQQFAAGPGKKQFAEDFLRMKMLAAEGTKNGLDKDPEVVRQLTLMRENLIANAQLGRIEKGITINEADLQKAYEANKGQYEQVKARHILIAFKGSPAADPEKTELTEEQAKAKAEALRKQLVAGANFDELAKKESDDKGSGARGGDLGPFTRGQMVDEFEKAAFSAKVGEIAPVVRTQFGYHIIKVDEHTTTPFAEVKEQLERAERQKRMQEALDAMKTSSKATFNEAYFAPPAPAAPATPPAPKQ
ncbi:MAG TPA: peptidylprolyl isomerase [Thermoanaerobaculia bacterium]|nr:peptidylprolyl isomerase [Thermoanaerobaculia bacterium]